MNEMGEKNALEDIGMRMHRAEDRICEFKTGTLKFPTWENKEKGMKKVKRAYTI